MTKCIRKSQKIMVKPNGFLFILDFFKHLVHLVQRVNILREILSIGQQSTFIPGALKIGKPEWQIRQTRNVNK